jgi:thiamine pyrophosphokinase
MQHYRFELPQLLAYIYSDSIEADQSSTVMLVLGGRPPETTWLKKASLKFNEIWAVDSGGEMCIRADLLPKYLIGDCDSIRTEDKKLLILRGTEIIEYPAEKDLTDYQLCLQIASRKGKKCVFATGGWGGRFDHAYGNLYSALWGMELGVRVICLSDENESLFYVYSGESIEIELKNIPHAFSLLALKPSCTVSVNGAKWNLLCSEITQKYPYAISNKPENDKIKIDVHEGAVGVYLVFES